MLVLLIGVPGVGKTTVLNEAKKYFNKKIKIVNFGDILLELVKEKYGIGDRDEIRKKLKKEDWGKMQLEVCKKIKEMEKEYNNIILDTHFVIETPIGYKSGLYESMAEILKPDYIIIITAKPEEILERRLKDKTRQRDIEDINKIELQQNLTINYGLILMYKFDCELIVLENPNGKLGETGKKLAEILNKLFE